MSGTGSPPSGTRWVWPLLVERGVELSAAQVYRPVTSPPVRLNMRVLAALCDALQCTPNDLIESTAADTRGRAQQTRGQTGSGHRSGGGPLAGKGRPTRVQVVPPAG